MKIQSALHKKTKRTNPFFEATAYLNQFFCCFFEICRHKLITCDKINRYKCILHEKIRHDKAEKLKISKFTAI